MNQKRINKIGNAQISTARSKIGTSSALFDGIGDGLLVYPDDDFKLGLGDFTVEFWVYETALNSTIYFVDTRSSTTGPLQFSIMGNASGTYFWANGSTRITGPAITINQWVHISVIRYNNATKLYIDGLMVGSFVDNISYDNIGYIHIGKEYIDSLYSVNGNIDEFRFSNIARHTANFTPSSIVFSSDANTILLLHMEGTNGSTTFVDDYWPVKTIIPYGDAVVGPIGKFDTTSLYFGHNNAGFIVKSHTDFDFNGDFTVELWAYIRSTTESSFELGKKLDDSPIMDGKSPAYVNRYLIDARTTSYGISQFVLYYEDEAIKFWTYNSGDILREPCGLDSWNHIALVRKNSVINLYVNGVSEQSITLNMIYNL